MSHACKPNKSVTKKLRLDIFEIKLLLIVHLSAKNGFFGDKVIKVMKKLPCHCNQ